MAGTQPPGPVLPCLVTYQGSGRAEGCLVLGQGHLGPQQGWFPLSHWVSGLPISFLLQQEHRANMSDSLGQSTRVTVPRLRAYDV